MHGAQVQAEDAEARARGFDFEERMTAPARTEPLVPLDFNATHKGERIAARRRPRGHPRVGCNALDDARQSGLLKRSEEHTSELQSRSDLVCRLLLEKKKKKKTQRPHKARIVESR